MTTANDYVVNVPGRLATATRDVTQRAATARARSAAAGDELAVSFDSDDRAAMVNVAALYLARVAYLDDVAAERAATGA